MLQSLQGQQSRLLTATAVPCQVLTWQGKHEWNMKEFAIQKRGFRYESSLGRVRPCWHKHAANSCVQGFAHGGESHRSLPLHPQQMRGVRCAWCCQSLALPMRGRDTFQRKHCNNPCPWFTCCSSHSCANQVPVKCWSRSYTIATIFLTTH